MVATLDAGYYYFWKRHRGYVSHAKLYTQKTYIIRRERLSDIIENMKMAEGLTSGIDYPSFIADKTIHYAVLRCIEIIGEASKHITDDIRLSNPTIPWKEMAGMRDKVIHFYMGVDFDVIWQVVRERYPKLRMDIEMAFEKMEE
jgi:uncharacterized protein with HEPN domain